MQQTLTFYELDLGLNHVVRKYAEPMSEQGNHLISVPGPPGDSLHYFLNKFFNF